MRCTFLTSDCKLQQCCFTRAWFPFRIQPTRRCTFECIFHVVPSCFVVHHLHRHRFRHLPPSLLVRFLFPQRTSLLCCSIHRRSDPSTSFDGPASAIRPCTTAKERAGTSLRLVNTCSRGGCCVLRVSDTKQVERDSWRAPHGDRFHAKSSESITRGVRHTTRPCFSTSCKERNAMVRF